MDSEESQKSEDHLSFEDIFQLSNVASSSSETLISKEESMRFDTEESPKMKLYLAGLYSPGSGEICAKYLTMSRSSMIRHQYYQYPSVKDPGIEKALLFPEEEKVYDEDGQELYLDLCKQMNLVPIRSFHKGLKTKAIDLRYYGVNPVGVRAICLALAYNQTVECLDLTSNFLNDRDACYHLGQLLGDRNVIKKLILSGCKIGFKGLSKVVVYLYTRSMSLLDLSENDIQDTGIPYLTEQIEQGAIIRRLNLRRNELTSESLTMLSEVLEYHDTIQYLDLSWNKFIKQKGPANLFRVLRESTVLVELNMAWTSLCIVTELGYLLGVETLKVLDLSHNRLGSPSARVLARGLYMAKNLEILDLSCNPFTPSDALYLLARMKQEKVKLKQLLMDHIMVSKEFAIDLKEIKQLEFRKNSVITHGDILRNYTLPEHDLKAIVMHRLVLNMKGKKKHRSKLDILLYFLEQHKIRNSLETSEFVRILKLYEAPLREDFIDQFIKVFPGPRTSTGNRSINLNVVVDYIHRLWPDKKLPPTPPPTPPPAPVTPKKKKGKKK